MDPENAGQYSSRFRYSAYLKKDHSDSLKIHVFLALQ